MYLIISASYIFKNFNSTGNENYFKKGTLLEVACENCVACRLLKVLTIHNRPFVSHSCFFSHQTNQCYLIFVCFNPSIHLLSNLINFEKFTTGNYATFLNYYQVINFPEIHHINSSY